MKKTKDTSRDRRNRGLFYWVLWFLLWNVFMLVLPYDVDREEGDAWFDTIVYLNGSIAWIASFFLLALWENRKAVLTITGIAAYVVTLAPLLSSWLINWKSVNWISVSLYLVPLCLFLYIPVMCGHLIDSRQSE